MKGLTVTPWLRWGTQQGGQFRGVSDEFSFPPGKSGLHECSRGSASLFSSHGRGIGPENVLKKDSRGLSWVAAGNPRFPRLLPGPEGTSQILSQTFAGTDTYEI